MNNQRFKGFRFKTGWYLPVDVVNANVELILKLSLHLFFPRKLRRYLCLDIFAKGYSLAQDWNGTIALPPLIPSIGLTVRHLTSLKYEHKQLVFLTSLEMVLPMQELEGGM